jgi:uncharacterized protein (DUF1697 family)
MLAQNKHMNIFIILLRGVTPTGKNKVLMAPLRAALSKAGLKDVQTYIQSGNVIATSNLTSPEIEELVHKVIYKSFGGDIAVLARTPNQFFEILKLNPFKEKDGKRLYFSLLATEPDKNFLEGFLSIDFSPDQVRFVNNTIYTLYATKHSDSKFNNNYFERKLKITATTRNFNTMKKLVDLASQQKTSSRR